MYTFIPPHITPITPITYHVSHIPSHLPLLNFSIIGSPPIVQPNARLIPGLFNNTLVPFLKEKNRLAMASSSHSLQVAWLNVDNDLYDGAVYILQHILPLMRKGGIIHFHDFMHINESTYQCVGMDEMKALYDVLQQPSAANPRLIGIKLEVLPLNSRNREVGLLRVL